MTEPAATTEVAPPAPFRARSFYASPNEAMPTLLVEEWTGTETFWSPVYVSRDAAFAVPSPGDAATAQVRASTDSALAAEGWRLVGDWVYTPEGAQANLEGGV